MSILTIRIPFLKVVKEVSREIKGCSEALLMYEAFFFLRGTGGGGGGGGEGRRRSGREDGKGDGERGLELVPAEVSRNR